jgi:hypothetical protein
MIDKFEVSITIIALTSDFELVFLALANSGRAANFNEPTTMYSVLGFGRSLALKTPQTVI